jgi:hypothetical protein
MIFTRLLLPIALFLWNGLFALAGEVRVTDSLGTVWSLDTSWQEGTRPYPKDLRAREQVYFEKNGEHWRNSTVYTTQMGADYMSPGIWEWEEYSIIPNGKLNWGDNGSQAMVYAAGGDSELTAVYSCGANGFWHVEPSTKEITFIGNLTVGGNVDGFDSSARLSPNRSRYSNWCTIDPVTGRLYFQQSGNINRYVEKLLLYMEEGFGVLHLPAYLDYKDMYTRVKGPNGGSLIPVMDGNLRGKPRFYVGTTPVPTTTRFIAISSSGWGMKFLLTSDGKTGYFESPGTWPKTFQNASFFDIFTGENNGKFALPDNFSSQTTGSPGCAIFGLAQHSGLCSGNDPFVYQCMHPGCCGDKPGKLFRLNPKTGVFEMLYDGTVIWNDSNNSGRRSFFTDTMHSTIGGPGDATTLRFNTTCFQNQCPRTGAILNGGWDAAGIRHYKDGFVTSFAQTSQMAVADFYTGAVAAHGGKNIGGRPEWDGTWPCNIGSIQSNPDIAPNGDVFITGNKQDSSVYPRKIQESPEMDTLRKYGIRIIRFHRTDWPAQQPVNGYANLSCPPAMRDSLMIKYVLEQFSLSLNASGTEMEKEDNREFGVGILAVSPNPFNPGMRISLSLATAIQGKSPAIRLLDVTGRLIMDLSGSVRKQGHVAEVTLKTVNLPCGTYLVEARYGTQRWIKRALLTK